MSNNYRFDEDENENGATVLDSFSITSGGRQLMQEMDEEEVWDGWADSKKSKRSRVAQWMKNRTCVVALGIVGAIIVIALIVSVAALGLRTVGSSSKDCTQESTVSNEALQALAKPVLGAMDRRIDPCTDFYQYACGGWLKETTIPSDKTSISRSFTSISDKNQKLLREILEDDWPVISVFYSNCMDNSTRDERGTVPLQPWLKIIDEVTSVSSLLRAVAALHKSEVPSLFAFELGTDLDDPSFGLPSLDQGGYGLPRDYYFKAGEAFDKIRTAYLTYVKNTIKLLGGRSDQELEAIVTQIINMETALANASQSPDERRDPYAVYHRTPLATLKSSYPNILWSEYFTTLGVSESLLNPINVANQKFFSTVNQLLNTTNSETWRSYMTWQLLRSTNSLLSGAFLQEKYAFSAALSGLAQRPASWKLCVGATSEYLGWIVDKVYVMKSFPADSKSRAKELISNLEDAFRTNMKKLEWMDSTTLEKALTKLDSIVNKVGYPDKWTTYDDLFVQKGKYFEAAMQVRAIERAKEFAKMGKPTDRGEWGMFSHDVNAYYRPDLNEIVFPAGILQPPFFQHDYLDSMNYGGIGMVIGHELSHGFDDEGRNFDASGKLVDWWSDSTTQQFTKKAECIKQQYSNFTVLGGKLHLNGGLTLGENIADIGGLKQAYTAFTHAGEKRVKDVNIVPELFDGITNNQLFFISFAQTWCSKYTDQSLTQLVTTNPHSPSEYRVTGPLRNSLDFAEAFKCPVGSPMNPKDKCHLW